MEELLKEIIAKLDALKGFMVLAATPVPEEEKVISTPFGYYRYNKEKGHKEKVEMIDGKWTAVAPETDTPAPPVAPAGEYLPAYNLYPWPGVDYGVIPKCPPGYQVLYDYNNNTAVCHKMCGPLGSR